MDVHFRTPPAAICLRDELAHAEVVLHRHAREQAAVLRHMRDAGLDDLPVQRHRQTPIVTEPHRRCRVARFRRPGCPSPRSHSALEACSSSAKQVVLAPDVAGHFERC